VLVDPSAERKDGPILVYAFVKESIMAGVRIAHARWMHVVVALLTAWTAAGTAVAQVKDVSPYHVVVTKDKADLRCGEANNYYRVAEIAAGTVLVVDGEGREFARVSYPAGVLAFVKAEEVTFNEAAKTVSITQPTRLNAINVTIGGISSSWQKLLAQPLPAGTTLRVSEPAKDEEGRVVAYKVTPPSQARGFVRLADVRRATPAEIETHRAKTGEQPEAPRPGATETPGTTPAPTPAPVPAPVPAPANNDAANKDAAKPATDGTTPPAGSDSSLVEPMVRPGETPPPAPEGQPAVTPTDAATPPAATDATTTVQPVVEAEPPAPKEPTIRELERAFELVRKQPADEGEYEALVGEFEKLQDAETRPGSRLHRQIQGRIDWLKMRLEIMQRQREIEDMKRRADSEGREVTTKLAELERQRQYAIVGRLLPSTVYDGQNLPLMYRLQSVTGSMVPRTIGYIRPTDELELPSKLNMVVGVIGDMKLDPAASLNIINALRVDILQAADGGPVRNPEPAPAPAPASSGQ
jgi:hypothetical protein